MHKKFDCVEMKHKAAEIIQKKIVHLSMEEELKFWRESFKTIKRTKEKPLHRHRD